MSPLGVNESDLDSPGYEFLRSHRNMVNLYYKLIALDYQRDFCSAYKCPSINQYYFSTPQNNSFEQQFVFASLCAWLIKDKCQMNFEVDLDDMSSGLTVIFEALKLLHESGQLDRKILVRLEQGHGPEVIYALSCLADRALEVVLEHDPSFSSSSKIFFHNKVHDPTRAAKSITIGQPIANSCRIQAKYPIYDPSLALDHHEGDSSLSDASRSTSDPSDWEQQVGRVTGQLSAFNLSKENDWQEQLQSLRNFKRSIQASFGPSKSVLLAAEARINREMQVMSGRETFLKTNLGPRLEDFMAIWRQYGTEKRLNHELQEKVSGKRSSLETCNTRLKGLRESIQARTRELNDDSKLRELQNAISNLETQSAELDVKVGLLQAVYGKR